MTFKATRPVFSGSGLTRCGLIGLFGSLLLPACSKSYLTDGEIAFTTGQESDAWSTEPAAKNVRVELVQSTRTTLANVAAPVTKVSIGTEGPQNVIASVDATGFDADGKVVMRGVGVPLQIFGFAGARINVFMGRVGGFSRAPGDLVFAYHHPQIAIQYHGYLLISGGDDARADVDLYDMARWRVAPVTNKDDNGAPKQTLPKVPESWAVSGSHLLLVDQTGPIWLDLSTGTSSVVDIPDGLDFANVVGGQTIAGPDDSQYIVGATRSTGKPSNVVVRVEASADPTVDATPSLHVMKLGTPRLGAAATIVDGRLLVVGGADAGAGAEVSNVAGTGFVELPFPADATQGAALAALDATTALLVGGRDPATDDIRGFRTLDLRCTEECTEVGITKPDFAFDRPRLFPLGEGQSLLVGDDPDSGETHVFSFDTGIGYELTEFPLRVPRAGASAVLGPNGQVVVLGGEAMTDGAAAKSVELFFPLP